jgi:hypothetical protein
MKLFKELSPEETLIFQKWARDNYKPFSDIRGIWHPVIVRECAKINEEVDYNG